MSVLKLSRHLLDKKIKAMPPAIRARHLEFAKTLRPLTRKETAWLNEYTLMRNLTPQMITRK